MTNYKENYFSLLFKQIIKIIFNMHNNFYPLGPGVLKGEKLHVLTISNQAGGII